MNLYLEDIIAKIKSDIIAQFGDALGVTRIRGVKKLIPSLREFSQDIVYLVDYFEKSDFLVLLDSLLSDKPIILFVCGAPDDFNESIRVVHDGKVVLLNSNQDADTLLNLISDLIVDNAHLIEKPAALFNTIVKGRGVPYIVEIASQLLENPILLGDSNHRLIASSEYEDLDDEAWMEFRNTGFCTYEYTSKFNFEGYLDQAVKTQKPIIGDIDQYFKYRRIFCAITINNRVIGHMAVLEYNRKFTDEDLEIADFISDIIASEMTSESEKAGTRNLLANQLLVDLLQGSIINEATLERRLSNMKWRLPQRKYLIAVKIDHFSESFALTPYFKETVEDKLCFIETIVYKNDLLMLVGCDQGKEFVREDFARLSDYLDNLGIKAGISQYFENMIDLASAYEQANIAQEVGGNINPEKSFYFYEDNAVYDLLNKVAVNHDLFQFCHPALVQLNEYDIEHKTDYLYSLYTYLINMGNLVASAEALFIHRNTLSYRLKKIEDIINFDINNRDNFMSLFISYRIMEYAKLI